MRIYVLNLERRQDRRRHMEAQARRLGLAFTFVGALDATAFSEGELRRFSRRGRLGRLAPGDIACARSHQLAWASFLLSGDRHAVFLEDDVVLSDDAAAFLVSASWVPPGAGVIKLERFGDRRHRVVMEAQGVPVASGRSLRRFHSKNVGAAAYVLSREAAQRLMERLGIVDLPIDHLLFNPNTSPSFRQFAPLQLHPAIAQQGTDVAQSDIHPGRVTQRRLGIAYAWREVVRGFHEVRLIPGLAWRLLRHGDVLVRPRFEENLAFPRRAPGAVPGQAPARYPLPSEA